MIHTKTEICKEIIDYYGTNAQLRQLAQECAELIQAATKQHDRRPQNFSDNFVEELADVEIMLTQFKAVLPPDRLEQFDRITRYKLHRQEQRMRGEQE